MRGMTHPGPEPYINDKYDRISGYFPAKHTVYTPRICMVLANPTHTHTCSHTYTLGCCSRPHCRDHCRKAAGYSVHTVIHKHTHTHKHTLTHVPVKKAKTQWHTAHIPGCCGRHPLP